MKTYYGLLKSGELRQYENPPKREHLTMKSIYSGQNSQHLLAFKKQKRLIHARSGYDRGPKLDRIIRKMLA